MFMRRKNGGKAVKKNRVFLYLVNGYAEIPLTKVLKGFGATVKWLDNDNAEIKYKDKKYSLSLKEPSFGEEGNYFNMLRPLPDFGVYY